MDNIYCNCQSYCKYKGKKLAKIQIIEFKGIKTIKHRLKCQTCEKAGFTTCQYQVDYNKVFKF